MRYVLTMLSLILFVLVFYCSCQNEQVFSKKAIQLNNVSPNETLKLYWQASYSGDAEITNSLTALMPKDMFESCVKPTIDEKQKTDIIPRPLEKENSKPFENIFTKKGVPENIALSSEIIFNSKILFERVKINEEKTYGSEAIIDFSVLDSSGELIDTITGRQIAFLKKFNDGWKVVGIVYKSRMFSNLEKINYAKPRPNCSENK